MNTNTLSKRMQWISYTGAFTLILMMVGLAYYFSDAEIILPEIAAMAIAIFAYREISWMRQPDKIFLLPTATAVLGFGINYLTIPYLLKLVIILTLMLALMYLIKFSLAPSLATGFLPIVSHAHSFSFIISILLCTFLLAAIVAAFKLNGLAPRKGSVDFRRMCMYFLIMVSWMLATGLSGYGLAIIPPVAVVVYESIHMQMYSVRIAAKQTIILFLSATIGVILYINLENWVLIASLDLILMFLLLYLFKMRVPAVYAFPLLAFILPREVVKGLPLTTLAMCIFTFGLILLYRRYQTTTEASSPG